VLPLAAAWVAEQETRILAEGTALKPTQLLDARAMGVAEPEKVRVLFVASIPRPTHPTLVAACDATGLVSPYTNGLCLRHGIYVRRTFAGDRFLLAHELVHTAQYERCGSILAFLRQYLHECLTIGYPAAPMEREAILKSGRLR